MIYLGEPTPDEIQDLQTSTLDLALVMLRRTPISRCQGRCPPWTDGSSRPRRARTWAVSSNEVVTHCRCVSLSVDAHNGVLVAWRSGELPADFTGCSASSCCYAMSATYDADATGALMTGIYQQFLPLRRSCGSSRRRHAPFREDASAPRLTPLGIRRCSSGGCLQAKVVRQMVGDGKAQFWHKQGSISPRGGHGSSDWRGSER